jgi:AmiR/NasT family two-component response regulator
MTTWEELLYRTAQAQGMVSTQAHCSLPDAIDLMKDRAQVQHRTLTEIAGAVLDRTIRFGE